MRARLEALKTERWPLLALFSLICAHIGLARRWISIQELPTGTRDEFFVVAETFDIAWQLQNVPFSQLAVYPLLIAKSYYPPLCRLPGVAALLSGGDYDTMIMAQWWWVPVLAVGTFIAARTVLSSWSSVAAVTLLLAAPGVHDTFHRYEPNLGSMAMAACVLAAWLYSRDLRNLRASLLAGLFLGMGMLTDRLGVLPFVLVPLAVSVTGSTARRESLKGLGILLLAAIAVAGWWYFDFFERFAHELLPQFSGGEISALGSELEDRPPFMLWWSHYLLLWPDSQLGLVGGCLALIGLVRMTSRRDQPAARSILWWLLPSLVLFSLIQKRQPFYTLGLLPAACICAALALEELAGKVPRAGPPIALALWSSRVRHRSSQATNRSQTCRQEHATGFSTHDRPCQSTGLASDSPSASPPRTSGCAWPKHCKSCAITAWVTMTYCSCSAMTGSSTSPPSGVSDALTGVTSRCWASPWTLRPSSNREEKPPP